MSIMRCDRCDRMIDTDDDPEAFVEVPWLDLAERVWCEPCREAEWEEHDRHSEPSEARERHAAFEKFVAKAEADQDQEGDGP